MARSQEETICGRKKKCGPQGSGTGQGARRGSQTQRGEEPRGGAAILGSQGRPQVWLRLPARPSGPTRLRRGSDLPGGLLRGAAAAAPLAAEAARLAQGRAAATAAGGRSEGDTVPPAATLSSPRQDPTDAPTAVHRAGPRYAARCPLQPAPERQRGPKTPPPPGWAASLRRRGPERQRRLDLGSGSDEGSPTGEGAGNGGGSAVGTARAEDRAEATRALLTDGVGRKARARAAPGATGRGCAARSSRTTLQLPVQWFLYPADTVSALGVWKESASVTPAYP